MSNTKTIILTASQIGQKINRIAYEIYENNSQEKEIIVAGIMPNGYILAQKIKSVLEKIAPVKVQLVKVEVDKERPFAEENKFELNDKEIKNKAIVLVDDVLNSGKTLIYGIKYFLNVPVKRIKTAVLIDRNHNRYPIKADFVGLSLSTTMQEHVSVELEKKNKEVVYLV